MKEPSKVNDATQMKQIAKSVSDMLQRIEAMEPAENQPRKFAV